MPDGPVMFDPLAVGTTAPAGASFLLGAPGESDLLSPSLATALVRSTAGVPPAAPVGGASPLVGSAWSEGIVPGRDSSGPVNLEVLHPEVKKGLQALRGAFGLPLTVTSAAGGKHAQGSQHYEDNAVDLAISGMSPEELQKLAYSARAAGFTGIGLANDHLHLDMRPGQPVVFADNSGGKYAVPTEWGGKSIDDWRRVIGGAGAVAAAPSASSGDFYHSLGQIESGFANILSRVDPDVAGPGSRSQGFYQINTPTWQQFAPKEVLAQYPNAMSAPEAVQRAVVANIPLKRFGPRTVEMLKKQYGFGDEAMGMTIGQLAEKYGGGGGSQGSGSAPVTAAPSAPPATPAQLFADEMKLQLLRGMFPQKQFTQVEYDPFKVMPKGIAPIDVSKGVG